MWEKIKKKIKHLEIVMEKGWWSPFVGAIIWRIIEWFVGGMQGSLGDTIFKSVEVWCGIAVSSMWYLFLLKSYTKKLEGLDRLERKLDKVERTGVEAVQAATGFIERAFGLQVMTELREKYHDPLLEALQALGFNLRNWENHVTKKQDDKIVLIDDNKKIAVWLRYMRTYYFEEAFDIRRKEVVTNGRNFCFMLLATLQAFLKDLGDSKLYYYAVTPVHPKDWYNWPHGQFKPRAYFEENFMGLFHRTLRGILKLGQVQSKVIHERYLLTADDVPKDFQPFGWRLDVFSTVKNQLRETWMLPVAVPIAILGRATCNVLKAFQTYYDWIASQDRFPTPDGDRLIVPLFCSSWEWKEVSEWFDGQINAVPGMSSALRNQRDSVEQAWKILMDSKSRESANVKELVNLAEDFHRGQLQDALGKIVAPSKCFRCDVAYNELSKDVGKFLDNNLEDVSSFIQQIHYYDVLLAEHDEREKQENLKSLLLAALRLRDCQLIPNPLNLWPSLGEVFAKNLHSSPERCWIVGLNISQMEYWYKSRVKPEFSFFGVKAASDTEPTWKLILATDLNYPFEVGKIRIIEPNDHEWKIYEDIIDKLINKKSFKFNQIHEVSKA